MPVDRELDADVCERGEMSVRKFVAAAVVARLAACNSLIGVF